MWRNLRFCGRRIDELDDGVGFENSILAVRGTKQEDVAERFNRLGMTNLNSVAADKLNQVRSKRRPTVE